MNICDLCSVPLGNNSTRYSSRQIRKAVQAGLRPGNTSFELGAAFGMSKEQSEKAWIQQVMSDSTDWLLCPQCNSKYRQFA